LNLNNEADLEQKLTEMYDPANPNYGKYMTPDEFRERYAPTTDQVQQVQNYLSANGVQGLNLNSNGYLISGRASVKALNSMLQTDIHQYKDATGKAFFAPSVEPVMPKGLPIQAIHGLNNVTQRHHHAQQLKAEASSPKSGTGHSGAFSPTDIRTAYNMPTSVNGSGQVLGLFELDAFNQSDITAYESYYNLPSATVTPVSVDSQSTSSPGGGIGEVTLDIELQLAVAPSATIIVYEGPNSDQGMIDTYAAIANANKAKSISTSWGSSESGTATSFQQSENTIFMQMAAQGQSIFSAAGDSGADDNGSSLSVDDPSSQPYMTAVGGTSLTLGSGSAYGSETTWSSGGGGISTAWTIPSWQQGLATSANLASSTMRNIPDVAVNADPSTGYDIYVSGGWGTWGGTSAAAPVWAGFIALVNQQRATGGQGPVGFVNPAIYALGKGQNYGSDFHDIADGSTNGHYPAESGYDDATGWGSMNGQNLFEDLSSSAVPTSGC
jgi:kumamolisin